MPVLSAFVRPLAVAPRLGEAAVQKSTIMSRCTLDLEGTVVVVAEDGALGAEYALFDPGDIELSATGPGPFARPGIGQRPAKL